MAAPIKGRIGKRFGRRRQEVQKSMRNIERRLERALRDVRNATPDALLHALKPVFDTSQQLVPVKTGRLKESGFMEAERTSQGARATIGYAADGDPFYATIVHERLDVQHASPTQAKFLEEAFNRHEDKIAPRVASFLREKVGL